MADITDGGSFYVHLLSGAATDQLQRIESRLLEWTAQIGTNAGAPVGSNNAGTLCAAVFNDGSGDSWFRAKIVKVTGTEATVRFIDYGNSATVPLSKIRPLDDELVSVPAQARPCCLAYIRTPELNEECGNDCAMALQDLAWGRQLVAKIVSRDELNRLHVVLFDGESQQSINSQIVGEGLGRMDKKQSRGVSTNDDVNNIRTAEDSARRQRLNLWRYGDIADDDSDDERTTKNAWGR